MNLDDLRAVQSRERATDSLQELRESFYGDAAEYVRSLREERDRAAAGTTDPFSSPEIGRLTDEIEMAEQVVEAIYERRVGKIVKQASLAAAGMVGEEAGLTPEEQTLYDDLVGRIAENKETVLDVLAGEEPAAGSAAETARPDGSDEAATAAAETTAEAAATPPDTADGSPAGPGATPTDDGTPAETPRPQGEAARVATPGGETTDEHSSPPPADAGTESDGDSDGAAGDGERGAGDGDRGAGDGERGAGDGDRDDTAAGTGADSAPAVDRTTVRITRDVGEILGVDERTYTLEAEDVVTLPRANAKPLLDREAAERLDAPDPS